MSLYANFVANGVTNNWVFNLNDPRNRDDCLYPYWLLREALKKQNVELNTPDVNRNKPVVFELHLNVQRRRSAGPTYPVYVLLLESSAILPDNASPQWLAIYQRIFTWDDYLVDGNRYIKIYLPNRLHNFTDLGWNGRDRLCCVIAGNKSTWRRDSNELYSKRVETIRWFERHAPQDFDLYGVGWDVPPAQPGYLGKAWSRVAPRLYRWTGIQPFPSYRGRIVSKLDTLSRYRFCICYENVKDLPGYITEKIFDCFFSGCVPIYWGAPNVDEYIPRNCFIDRRQFSSHGSLYEFLVTMAESEYVAYQNAIQSFVSSEAAKPFYAEAFSSTVINVIKSDFESCHVISSCC